MKMCTKEIFGYFTFTRKNVVTEKSSSTLLIFKTITLLWVILLLTVVSILSRTTARTSNTDLTKKRPELFSPPGGGGGGFFFGSNDYDDDDDHDDDRYRPFGQQFPLRPEVAIPSPPHPHRPLLLPPPQGLPEAPVAFSASRAHPLSRGCPNGACVVIFEYVIPAFSAGGFDRLVLFQNDREVISSYGLANGFGVAGNSIILHLQPGHKVCLKLLEGELYESDAPFRSYTSFTGFLLQNHGRCCHPPDNDIEIFPAGSSGPFSNFGINQDEFGPRHAPLDIDNATTPKAIK